MKYMVVLLSLCVLPLAHGADVIVFHALEDIASNTDYSVCTSTPFDFTNQIFLVCDSNPKRLSLLGENYPYVHNFILLDGEAKDFKSGSLTRAKGYTRPIAPTTRRDQETPGEACITNLTILGPAPWPATVQASARDIDRLGARHFVEVEGTVGSVLRDATNAAWNWIILRTPTGTIRAAMTEHDYPYASLLPLVDAEVRLRGITHESTTWRKFLGYHVILFGADGIVTLRPTPEPFDAPPLTDHRVLHRQQLRGTVLGCSISRVFIQDANGRFISLSPQEGCRMPAVGSVIAASGFASLAPMGYQLTETVIRVDRKAASLPPPIAEPTDPERMFATALGNEIADAALYGKLIRLRGTVANSQESIRTDEKILLECGKRTISVDVRHLAKDLVDIPVHGCEIDVSGICLSDFEVDVTNIVFPKFNGFVLVPRTANDIVIVRHPPWWTPFRLLCVIAVLVVFLLIILVWNRMLKILSERRGHELYREQIESARADLKVEERTHLAIELHDSISQTLTGVALQIDAATRTGKTNPSATEKFLETARTMLASCRQELRCCIWDLKSRTFDEQDMTEAVQKTLAPHIGSTDLQIRFNVPRTILSESAAHDTLRIIRELAVNALRHGHASHLRVAGEYRDGLVRFSVRDDGTGFDQSTVLGPADGHFGLQGIRERIKGRNGTMEIDSSPGRGTKVTVTLMADEKGDDEK